MISLVFPQIFWSGITMSPCPCLRPPSRWQWATGTESQQKLFLLRKLRLGKFWTAAIWPNPGQSEGKALKADLCLGLESLLIKQWRTFLSRPAGMLQHFLYPFLLGGPPPLQAEDWPLNFSWGNFPFTVPRLKLFLESKSKANINFYGSTGNTVMSGSLKRPSSLWVGQGWAGVSLWTSQVWLAGPPGLSSNPPSLPSPYVFHLAAAQP